MKELVSVIIPTYKRPFTTLSRAINSVLNQSYTNIELIIVDDNPNGEAYKKDVEFKVKKLKDSRIKYIQHENNQGACVARNTGIKNSKGKYIGFLDDDDEWLSNKLELQVQKFNDEKVGLVYCDSFTITMKSNVEVQKEVRSFRNNGMVYNQLIERNFVGSTSFVLLKKETIISCGDFNTEMKSAQDFELWLRISKKYKIDYVDIPLVRYYAHDGERISTNNNSKIQGLEHLNKLNFSFLQKNRRIHSIRKSTIIPYYYARDGYRKALQKSWESFILYPFNKHLFKTMVKLTINRIKFLI